MADKRISQLVDRGTVVNNDVVPIVVFGATTTNKATISSIQTFMQGNLDLGVTSVGITLGSSGTDVSVTGSPITSSGNITINLPTASATNRGLLSAADWSTFNNKQGAITLTTTGTSGVSTLVGSTLNIPNYSTDLSGYVTLGTAQTITAQKTIQTNSGSDTFIVNHTSGNGIGVNITKGGNNEALRVAKTSGSGNAVTITGGLLSAEAATLTGALNGTSATFGSTNGIITANRSTTSFASLFKMSTAGVDNWSLGIPTLSTADWVLFNHATGISNLSFASATGAATFSSSVTASSLIKSGGTSSQFLKADGSVDSNTYLTSASGTTGSGTTNFIPKFTGTNSIGNSNIFDAGATIYNNSATANEYAWTFFGSATTGQSYGALVSAGTNSSDVSFEVKKQGGLITLFRVRGDGNVGINTTSPSTKLHIVGTTEMRFDTTSSGSLIQFWKDSDASFASSIGNSTPGGSVQNDLLFSTYNGSSWGERMRITAGGAVTIANLGTGTVMATAGTLSTVSDSSFKVDDGFIDSALDKVLNLKPRYFYWNEKSGLPTDVRQLGFYAQEVNEALGEEAANTPQDENTAWGIADRSVIAMLTKAIQEQQEQINSLKNQIK